MRVLVTGVTGYVGGRLVPLLLDAGHRVRILVRDPRRAEERPWAPRVELVRGDATDRRSLSEAMEAVDVAYYLVRSTCIGAGAAEIDRTAAENWVAVGQNLRRVVYLSRLTPGLDPGESPTEHVVGRGEVGRVLRGGVPTVEIRAGPIIGPGSAYFEMIRHLTERLPALVAPRWARNEVQPIGVDDLLRYLVLAVDRAGAEGVVEVGTEAVTALRMMETHAEIRGLKRSIVPLPVLAQRLSAFWVGLLTPLPTCLARHLLEGVAQPVLADRSRARLVFPEVEPMPYHCVAESAVRQTEAGNVTTHWSGTLGGNRTYEFADREGIRREVNTRFVDAPAEVVYRAFSSLGGETGWLFWNRAWQLRGFLDQLAGGPGLRRGRRDSFELQTGEAVDFWRVEEACPPKLLRLRAEMKLPGRAWLQWEVRPDGERAHLVQTASFAPEGLSGFLYWYALYPVHRIIFRGLLDSVARRAVSWTTAGARGPGMPAP